MPSLEKHIALSKKRTGKEYREVHEWLDGRMSYKERIARHDIVYMQKFLPLIEKKFGKAGAREYLQHLKDDHEKSIFLMIYGKIVKMLRNNP